MKFPLTQLQADYLLRILEYILEKMSVEKRNYDSRLDRIIHLTQFVFFHDYNWVYVYVKCTKLRNCKTF